MNRLLVVSAMFCAALSSVSAQSYPSAWNLAHPDANALLGLDVRTFRDSPAGAQLSKSLETAGKGMLSFPGIGFLQEIDQVFVSSPAAKVPTAKEKAPVLIVLTGRFTPAHIAEISKGKRTPYHGVDIHPSSGANAVSMIVLDERTIVFGDLVSLKGAIDRKAKPLVKAPTGLLARATALAPGKDFWLVANVPPSAVPVDGNPLAPMMASIRGVEAGLAMHDGFQLEVNLATKSPQDADQLAQMAAGWLQAALSGNTQDPDAAEMLKKLQVGSDGERAQIKLALTQSELDQQMKKLEARNAARPSQSAGDPPFRSAEVVTPAVADNSPKTIKIYGLDEGVREIPFPPARN